MYDGTTTETCAAGDELGIQYLLAADQVDVARRELSHSVTQTQQESAATRLGRVEAHKLYALGELLSHCVRHGCPLPLRDEAAKELLASERFKALAAAGPPAELPGAEEEWQATIEAA
ncbi:MAG: hypothetical protein LAP87_14335 [Acidobacteriia bacterium]|nr:hypothetical protein [Terriglobia bacterium]